jgi:hypothetical protein
VAVIDGSLDVFRANPRLAVLPLASLLLVGSGFAVAAGVALHYGLLESVLRNDLLRYAAVFVGLALSSSLGTFFNAAVVHCAAQYFDGEEPAVREGLAAAWAARRAIAVWAVTAATLGTVFYALDEKFGVFGSLARFVFDLAWALLTFFVVPVIVLEDTADLRTILRESGSAFRETWGESVTASLGISFALLPVALVGVLCLGAAYVTANGATAWLLGGVGFVVLVASMVTAQVLGMVARTALYRYATTGDRAGPFEDLAPGSVFPSK